MKNSVQKSASLSMKVKTEQCASLKELQDEWTDDKLEVRINNESVNQGSIITKEIVKVNEPMKFTNSQMNEIQNNMLDRKNELKYKCKKCDFASENKKSFRNHNIRNVHSAKMYRCIYPLCNYESMAKKTFLRHIENIHEPYGEKLTCEFCDYQVSKANKSNILRHIKIVHLKLKESKCPQCDYSSSNKADIDKHVKSIHLRIKEFACESCSYKTSYKYILDRHEKAVHNRVKDVPCPYIECTFKATLNKYLSRHIKNVHEPDQKKYECSECDYKSIEKGMLDRHIANAHQRIKDFNCNSCDYKTNSKYSLEKHIKVIHEGIKEYRCSSCEYQTSEKSALTNHERAMHLKTKAFECNYCKRKFSIKNSLQTHIKLAHLKMKPMKCSYEGCRFKTFKKNRLEDHKDMCHTETISCPECNYEAKDNSFLPFHFESKHPGLRIDICSRCMYYTKHENGLSKHMKICHARSSRVMRLKTCKECGFQTNQRKLLLQHIKINHPRVKGSVVHSCLYCTLTFDKNKRLVAHMKQEHWKELGKQTICCTYCNFEGGYSFVMKDHYRKTHNMEYIKEEFKTERESWKSETLLQFDVELKL